MSTTPDWEALTTAAASAMSRAYAPYSHYPVGAAGLVQDGRMVSGCNVENASFGLTLCAECSMVSHLIGTGGGKLVAVVCVDQYGAVIMPCGRCRQLIAEHAAQGCTLMTPRGPLPMEQVLPLAFGPDDLV